MKKISFILLFVAFATFIFTSCSDAGGAAGGAIAGACIGGVGAVPGAVISGGTASAGKCVENLIGN
ncbi:MAG: hypothetical protein ACK5MH_10490 [Bacteroidales bacterium]